jgi:hypothetical protein
MRYLFPFVIMIALAYAALEYSDLPILGEIKSKVNNVVDFGAVGDAKKAVGGTAGGIFGRASQTMVDNLANDISIGSKTNKAACMLGNKQCVKMSDCSSAAQVGENGLITALPDGYSNLRGSGDWPSSCIFTVTDNMGGVLTSKPVGIVPAP